MEEINQVKQVLLEHDIGAPMHYMHDELVNIGNMVKAEPQLKILNYKACIRMKTTKTQWDVVEVEKPNINYYEQVWMDWQG